MLEGAIIGGIVGFIVSFIMVRKRAGAGKRVFAAFMSGGVSAGRTELDGWVKPVTGKLSLQKLLNTLERMAALAIIGDLTALEQEIAAVDGKLTVVTQVRAMGLAGLATESDDPAPYAKQLVELAAEMEAKGGAMLKLVKRNTRAMANVASALAGLAPMDSDSKSKLTSYANQMGPFTKPLLYKFLAKATEASGGDPAQLLASYKAAAQHL